MPERSKLDTKGIENIRRNIGNAKQSAIINTARAVAIDAANRAPVDTEYLRESIHITTINYTEYPISFASSTEQYQKYRAIGKTPKGRYLGPRSENSYEFLPETRPAVLGEAFVVVGARHGFANERDPRFGKPYLVPALNANRGRLSKEIRNALNGISVRSNISTSFPKPATGE